MFFQQNLAPRYQILVYEMNLNTREARIIESYAWNKLYIQYKMDEKINYEHYSLIKNIRLYLRVQWYCDICLLGCYDRLHRKCKYTCSLCEKIHKINDNEQGRFKCEDCNRVFSSWDCMTKHKEVPNSRKALCDLVKECPDCCALANIRRRKAPHECGQ